MYSIYSKTSCKHEDIAYLAAYQGKTKEQVDSHIMPLMTASHAQQQHQSQGQAAGSASNDNPSRIVILRAHW